MKAKLRNGKVITGKVAKIMVEKGKAIELKPLKSVEPKLKVKTVEPKLEKPKRGRPKKSE